MPTIGFGPDSLDYLRGLTLDPTKLPHPSTWPVPVGRRCTRVLAIGVSDRRESTEREPALATTGLLAGLAGEYVPISFAVEGWPDGVQIRFGTWSSDGTELAGNRSFDVLAGLLNGLYPVVRQVEEVLPPLQQASFAGIASGVPIGVVDPDGLTPWDRLLRSMAGQRFSVLVVADPLDLTMLTDMRRLALEDLRIASSAEGTRQTPLLKSYTEHAEALGSSLDLAISLGGWRVAAYLLGDATSYWRLAAAWQSTFGGDTKRLLPLRTFRLPAVRQLADAWSLPDQEAPAGPGAWRYPFANQTVLNSRQLAAYIHLPANEVAGFGVRPAPRFSARHLTTRETPHRMLSLGPIVVHERPTGGAYEVGLDQLTRHCFIAGLTGAGKTNTLMHTLLEATRCAVPFLVVEPTKSEYRELLSHPWLAGRLRVFTVGREDVAPLRLNPFEVPTGTPVSAHVELLKTVFTACFALWIPLPQVFERALVELYTERGWSFETGANELGGAATDVYPTLSDVVARVRRIVPTMGYKTESTQEITASLVTRLEGLARGARGLMLDVAQSVPIEEILAAPTVIELEGLGDDDDKALIMALLLTRLFEYRRAEHAKVTAGGDHGLRHLMVVEEAHRLLSAETSAGDSTYHANPKAAFVEVFGQLLAEVRAYGQGIVIADQVPVRLAPDVLKNSNLKIAHRLVATDDREAMAGAMGMNEEQSRQLAVLERGWALVFSEPDHMPAMVRVPQAKGFAQAARVDDLIVGRLMATWRADPRVGVWYQATPGCSTHCTTPSVCRTARQLARTDDGTRALTRMWFSAAEHPDGIDAAWAGAVALVRAQSQSAGIVTDLLRSYAHHGFSILVSQLSRRGDWTPDTASRIKGLLDDVVQERLSSDGARLGLTAARAELAAVQRELQQRDFDPYPLCGQICPDGRCAFRRATQDILADSPLGPTRLAELTGAFTDDDVQRIAALTADDLIAIGAAEDPAFANLNAARWRAYGCATQLSCATPISPSTGAARAVRVLANAGWALEPESQ